MSRHRLTLAPLFGTHPMTSHPPPTTTTSSSSGAMTGSFFADVYDTATSMVSQETLTSFAQDVRGGLETGLEAARGITARASAFAERTGVTSEVLDALLRRQRAEEKDTRVDSGVGAYVYEVEKAMEGWDVRHAHVEGRAQLALRSSAELDATIAKHEGQWTALERELSEVSGMTAKVWEYSESLNKTIAMMGEVEEMLLEAEIGAQLDALYRRRDDAERAELEAEVRFHDELAHVRQLQDLLASDAMSNQVSSRTTEEITAEQELKRKLASLAKKKSRESASASMEEQTLAELASTLDVSANMASGVSPNDLDDFFTQDDEDEEGGETSGKAYTLYGLRARADQSKGAILNEPQDKKPTRGVDEEMADRIAQARKEALGIRDEDMAGVNLRPPPPSGGAGSSPLDEAQSPRRIVIESKSVTGQVTDKASKLVDELRSFSFSAAAEAAAAAAASAVSDVTTRLRKQGNAEESVRDEREEVNKSKQSFYKKKDAGTST